MTKGGRSRSRTAVKGTMVPQAMAVNSSPALAATSPRGAAACISSPRWRRSAHGRHDVLGAGADTGGPTGGDRLQPGIEAHALGPVHVVVTEEGALPAPEAVKCHGHGDRHIDSHHSDLDLGREVPGRIAVAGEDRGAVAILMLVDQLDGGIVVGHPHHREHGAEDLLLVDAHRRLHLVEKAAAEIEAVLVALQLETPAIHEELGPFLDAEIDIAPDLVQMLLRDARTHL